MSCLLAFENGVAEMILSDHQFGFRPFDEPIFQGHFSQRFLSNRQRRFALCDAFFELHKGGRNEANVPSTYFDHLKLSRRVTGKRVKADGAPSASRNAAYSSTSTASGRRASHHRPLPMSGNRED